MEAQCTQNDVAGHSKEETKAAHGFGLNLAVSFGEGRRENLEEVQMFPLFQKDQK